MCVALFQVAFYVLSKTALNLNSYYKIIYYYKIYVGTKV